MKKCFLTGLVTLLPLAVTFWIVKFVINFLTKPFVGVATSLLDRFPEWSIGPLDSHQFVHTLSQIAILISLFLFILFLGFVAREYFFTKLTAFGDHVLHRIPLINKVYRTSKEIVQSLFAGNKNSFKQVVLVPFPYRGCYCIGLVANDAPDTCSDAQNTELVSVFLPTTPNPTTGFLIMCPKSDMILLEMRPEEAIKYIVSCAVIQPSRERL